MRNRFHILLGLVLTAPAFLSAQSDSPQFVRSVSGPSGKVVGSNFAIDESRNRFVYPSDSSFVVLFEWKVKPGDYTLTALLQQPDGRIASISPDVKIQTQTNVLRCYWTYLVEPSMSNGIWAIQVRINGQPAGSHNIEIAGTEPRTSAPAAQPAAPKLPTLDQIYNAARESMVWIHKLDDSGRRTETDSGFILGRNRIATAFQAIDASRSLEVEFADGRTARVQEILGCSRLGDWALLGVDTGSAPPISQGDAKTVGVGQRLLVFNVEGNSRVFGGVDIAGLHNAGAFGERIQFSPAVSPQAAGGALLDNSGKAVGILGGSTVPGARFSDLAERLSAGLWNSFAAEDAATPISAVSQNLSADSTLETLAASGILTAPLVPMPEFLYGSVTTDVPKHANNLILRELSEFSTHDSQISIYSMWVKRSKLSKGLLSGSVYDATNRLRVTVPPKKVSLSDIETRLSFSFSPQMLEPGIYRVDVNWDGRPAWRTFLRITN